jgi:hypothetical protein
MISESSGAARKLRTGVENGRLAFGFSDVSSKPR